MLHVLSLGHFSFKWRILALNDPKGSDDAESRLWKTSDIYNGFEFASESHNVYYEK